MSKENEVYRWIKVLVFNFALFFLLIIIGEIGVRIINPGYELYVRTYPGQHKDRFFSTNSTTVNWPKKDMFLGWVCNDTNKYLKFSNKIYNKIDEEYNVNRHGFRCQTIKTQDSLSESNILMLGDSFLFGVYLKEEEIITNLLEDKFNNNYKFINLGIPGYGIDQMYLSYIKFNKTIKPKVVILFYVDIDIYRTYESFRFTEGMNKPSFDIKDGKLVPRIEDKPSIVNNIFQCSHLLNPFYEKYSHWQSKILTLNIFENLIRITKTHSQKLLIIRCPADYQLINDDKFSNLSFKNMFIETNVSYYELFEDLKKFGNEKIKKMYLAGDVHLSPYGTKIVSELIFSKIKEIGILIE